MLIHAITMHHIQLELKAPFATANGVYLQRETILIEAEDASGAIGWGECVAFSEPWYTEETVATAWHILERFLIPAMLGKSFEHPSELSPWFANIKRHHMAKAGLEMACWDVFSRVTDQSLASAMGGKRNRIDAGIAIGLQGSADQLLQTLEQAVEQGYKRVKIKIKPGEDLELIRTIRRQFPDLPLMADANSAYTLADIDRLKQLDRFELLMIEQPLAADDIIDHAKLQQQMSTPICLDESITDFHSARKAIELGSCQIINLKIGRVGGLSEAMRIHDLCMEHGLPVWCGGMLESGVGRAHNIALASLSNFIFPGDISASSRYWTRDITQPEVVVQNGQIAVPTGPGIGFQIDREFLGTVTVRKRVYGFEGC